MIEVAPADDPPTARPDTATTTEGNSVSIDILGNDSDPEGAVMLDSLDTTETEGSVSTGLNGNVIYDPNQDDGGSGGSSSVIGFDSFSYTIKDGIGQTATADVTVYVADADADDPPWARNDWASTVEDTPVDIGVTGNDWDHEGSVTVINAPVDTTAGDNTLAWSGNTASYTPPANFSGTDGFSYTNMDTGDQTASSIISSTGRTVWSWRGTSSRTPWRDRHVGFSPG